MLAPHTAMSHPGAPSWLLALARSMLAVLVVASLGVMGAITFARGLTSLTRRLIGVAALWVGVLLLGGGFALDRVLTKTLTENFDKQLELVITGM
ncbi:MAG: hypothetical protein IAG13_00080, partial [Deltaproteobacteria bacterium]|nr:hypothetical protein [Nannocystaceae bacterium]